MYDCFNILRGKIWFCWLTEPFPLVWLRMMWVWLINLVLSDSSKIELSTLNDLTCIFNMIDKFHHVVLKFTLTKQSKTFNRFFFLLCLLFHFDFLKAVLMKLHWEQLGACSTIRTHPILHLLNMVMTLIRLLCVLFSKKRCKKCTFHFGKW